MADKYADSAAKENHEFEREQRPVPGDLENGHVRGEDSEKTQIPPADPNLVTWDEPKDSANPKTWSFKRKWLATGLVSLITFMTPIASSMIAPAETAIDNDLNVHSGFLSQLIFSIFLLAFVVGPLFIAPLSEVYGRVIVLQLANVNLGEILAFRFLAGLGACAPQTVGGGVISDLWTAEERGMAIALYSLAPALGPAVGPLIGAWITDRTTWRWSFWAVTIFGVVVQVLVYFTLDETYAPLILERKAKKLRQATGNEMLHTQYNGGDRRLGTVMRTSLSRVFVMLGTQPIVQFLALYLALNYGIVYLMLSIYPVVWSTIYHESVGTGGLNYISLMIGMTIGAQSSGKIVDWTYRRLSSQAPNKQGRAEFRVPVLFLSTFLLAGGLFIYGWSAQYHVHWIVPNIGAAIFAAGTIMTVTSLQAYTIDCYALYAASAIGATAVARSIAGFGFPLFATYMFDALGQGWGNSVLAFLALGIGYSGSLVLWFYGERLRRSSQYAANEGKTG